MKVVTLKNIPEVPAPAATEPTDRYFPAAARGALKRSGSVSIPRMAGKRRIFPTTSCPDDGLLFDHIPGAHPWPQELANSPEPVIQEGALNEDRVEFLFWWRMSPGIRR
jgi:hypothetical protein